jgi:hypothetical protein
MMTWIFHENATFPGYGWIEPIMSPDDRLLPIELGEHIVERHNHEIEQQEPYKWPNP